MACENVTFTIVHKRQVTVDIDNYDRCDSRDNMDFSDISDKKTVIFCLFEVWFYGDSGFSSFIYLILVQVLGCCVVQDHRSGVGSSSCCWFFD